MIGKGEVLVTKIKQTPVFRREVYGNGSPPPASLKELQAQRAARERASQQRQAAEVEKPTLDRFENYFATTESYFRVCYQRGQSSMVEDSASEPVRRVVLEQARSRTRLQRIAAATLNLATLGLAPTFGLTRALFGPDLEISGIAEFDKMGRCSKMEANLRQLIPFSHDAPDFKVGGLTEVENFTLMRDSNTLTLTKEEDYYCHGVYRGGFRIEGRERDGRVEVDQLPKEAVHRRWVSAPSTFPLFLRDTERAGEYPLIGSPMLVTVGALLGASGAPAAGVGLIAAGAGIFVFAALAVCPLAELFKERPLPLADGRFFQPQRRGGSNPPARCESLPAAGFDSQAHERITLLESLPPQQQVSAWARFGLDQPNQMPGVLQRLATFRRGLGEDDEDGFLMAAIRVRDIVSWGQHNFSTRPGVTERQARGLCVVLANLGTEKITPEHLRQVAQELRLECPEAVEFGVKTLERLVMRGADRDLIKHWLDHRMEHDSGPHAHLLASLAASAPAPGLAG